MFIPSRKSNFQLIDMMQPENIQGALSASLPHHQLLNIEHQKQPSPNRDHTPDTKLGAETSDTISTSLTAPLLQQRGPSVTNSSQHSVVTPVANRIWQALIHLADEPALSLHSHLHHSLGAEQAT